MSPTFDKKIKLDVANNLVLGKVTFWFMLIKKSKIPLKAKEVFYCVAVGLEGFSITGHVMFVMLGKNPAFG